jgi:hypothetical protein
MLIIITASKRQKSLKQISKTHTVQSASLFLGLIEGVYGLALYLKSPLLIKARTVAGIFNLNHPSIRSYRLCCSNDVAFVSMFATDL